jgi:hypothetical protein
MSDISSRFRFIGGGMADPLRGAVFDPLTLAALGMSATTISTISTIATVAGPLIGIAGAVSEMGEARAQAAEFDRQSKEERIMANVDAERARRAARQTQSRDRVAALEGGAYSGTMKGVLDQNAVAQELDALTVQFQGEQRGKQADFQAKQAKRAASPLKVFSAAIGGFANMDPLAIGN